MLDYFQGRSGLILIDWARGNGDCGVGIHSWFRYVGSCWFSYRLKIEQLNALGIPKSAAVLASETNQIGMVLKKMLRVNYGCKFQMITVTHQLTSQSGVETFNIVQYQR